MPRDGAAGERNGVIEFDLVRRVSMLVVLVLLALVVGSFVI